MKQNNVCLLLVGVGITMWMIPVIPVSAHPGIIRRVRVRVKG